MDKSNFWLLSKEHTRTCTHTDSISRDLNMIRLLENYQIYSDSLPGGTVFFHLNLPLLIDLFYLNFILRNEGLVFLSVDFKASISTSILQELSRSHSQPLTGVVKTLFPFPDDRGYVV